MHVKNAAAVNDGTLAVVVGIADRERSGGIAWADRGTCKGSNRVTQHEDVGAGEGVVCTIQDYRAASEAIGASSSSGG